MPNFGEVGGTLFKSLGEALARHLLPDDMPETEPKVGAETGADVGARLYPELPDYVRASTGEAPKAAATPLAGAPTTPPTPTPAPRVKVKMPPQQPLAPTSRVQQLAPEHAEAAARIELSPTYLDRLDDLGAGRRVTHDETWARAINAKPMTIDELSNWGAHRKVNEVDVARAGLLRKQLWDGYFDAMKNEDDANAMEYEKAIEQIEPGYNSLTATPGRATEFQRVFQEQESVQNRVRQLRQAGVPFSVVNDEIGGMMKDMQERNADVKDPEVQSLLRRVEDYATAAKLSSPVTWENKALTDGITYLQRGVEKHIEATIADMQGRPEDAEAMRAYAFGTSQGFKDGWHKFLEAFDPLKTPKSDVLDKPMGKTGYAISFPFRVLSGVTNLWQSVIYDSEINTRCYAMAKKVAGSDPELLGPAMQKLKANLPQDWQLDAQRVANEYTFMEDPDRLLRFMQKGQNLPGMRFFIPIVKIPYNITRFAVRRSPLGLFSPRNIEALKAGGADRARVAAQLGLGIGLYGLATSLAAHGNVNGAMPQDPRERALWTSENRQPFSVRFSNDDTGQAHYLKFNRLGPIGVMLSMATSLHSAMQTNDFDTAQKLERGLMDHITGMTKRMTYQAGEGALDIPFVDDLKTLLDGLMEPDKKFESLSRMALTGFLPNILRDVRNQVDPSVRQPTSVPEAIENIIPGLSGQVMQKRTVLGQPIEQEADRLGRAFKIMSPSLEDENTQFLRSISWSPTPPSMTLHVRGVNKKIDPENREAYTKEMGEATLAAVRMCKDDPRIAPLDTPMKRRVVARVVEAARAPIVRKYQILTGLYGPEAQAKEATAQ